jgi:hypothetical protein
MVYRYVQYYGRTPKGKPEKSVFDVICIFQLLSFEHHIHLDTVIRTGMPIEGAVGKSKVFKVGFGTSECGSGSRREKSAPTDQNPKH